MGARPPQNDTSEPEVIEFGIAALSARLENTDVEFPATSQTVVDAIEETAIPIDGSGHTMELQTAFDTLAREQFETEAELLELLHPVFEEHRKQTNKSVVSRLRMLLPF